MKVVPLGDKVVVKRLEADETTARVESCFPIRREKTKQGRVLSVGDGKLLSDGERAKHQVSEGDRVLFSPYAGSEVQVDGQELLIMSEEDILAVLD